MRIRLVILTLSLLFAPGCGRAVFEPSLGKRTGPPFAEAFPDASVLLTTSDVDGVRDTLSNVLLPETDEHHDRLVALLEQAGSIDADHLLLLTEAVALGPVPLDQIGSVVSSRNIEKTGVTIRIDGGSGNSMIQLPRGDAPYSGVLDRLLLLGLSLLDGDPDARQAGALLGRTQSLEALTALADRFLPVVDDGSPEALDTILSSMRDSTARQQLITDILLPREQLEGQRERVALESLSFDENRRKLIRALLDRRSELVFDEAFYYQGLMSFDTGRNEVIEMCRPLLERVEADQLRDAMNAMAFDSGRQKVLELLAPLLSGADFGGVAQITQTFKMDGNRSKGLETLCRHAEFSITGPDLPRVAGLASFDSSRLENLQLVRSHLEGPIDPDSARDLVGIFSFDSGKLELIELFQGPLKELPWKDREALVSSFSFDSGSQRARQILDM